MTTSTPPRALIVSCRNTFLVRTGASEYLAAFARSLGQAGFETSILFIEEMPSKMARVATIPDYVALFETYRFFKAAPFKGRFYSLNPRHWIDLLARKLGRSSSSRPSYGLDFNMPTQAALAWGAEQMRELRPSLVVANYFNAASIFAHVPADTTKAILTHDVLSARKQSFEAAGETPDFDVALVEQEIAAFKAADICFAIKDEERAIIQSLAPGVEVVTLPVTLNISKGDLEADRPPVCIFVGGDNSANKNGLDWFMAEVWPIVRRSRPAARLRIVGAVENRMDGSLPDGVDRRGFVDDLSQEYAQAAVAITPLLFGSGVKIKLIEGLSFGLPSVATSVGAQGIAAAPPEVLRIEDTAEGFAQAVLDAFDAPDAARRRAEAREFARRHYDQSRVGADIIKDLVQRGLIPTAAGAAT